MMKERRALIEGLNPVDAAQAEREKAFVYGDDAADEETPTPAAAAATPPAASVFDKKVLPQFTGRVPVTTRARPEVASALKRAALTRQLNGIEPYYVQDIMEQALESWLATNGYLDNQ